MDECSISKRVAKFIKKRKRKSIGRKETMNNKIDDKNNQTGENKISK